MIDATFSRSNRDATAKILIMKQQTAVDWLFEKMAQTPMTNWYEIRVQALYMEKEEMRKIWMDFFNDSYHCEMKFMELFDKYYKEKYEKNNP